tara:strand:- start:19 stop:567 length:549 start_codon:yes stop_codon:yes gene_type:complete
MACDLTAGYTLSCRDSAGGIQSLYILSGSISSIDETSNEITAINGTGTFFEFQLPRNVGSVSEAINASLENGTVFYETTAELVMQKLQTSVRNQVALLSQNPNLKIIVRTNNGQNDGGTGEYFLLGRYRGLSVSGGTGATGTAFGDLSGYSLTFTGQEPTPMFEIATTGNDLSTALVGITVG